MVVRSLQISNSAAVSSCTSALYLSLKALGIGEGDEVITTSMTFCSTVNVILHTGAKPVLCDIDPNTNNINPKTLKERISYESFYWSQKYVPNNESLI